MRKNYAKIPFQSAQALGLDRHTHRAKDGAVVCSLVSLLQSGRPMVEMEAFVTEIGGILLTQRQALAEIRGEQCLPMPLPTKPLTSATEEENPAVKMEAPISDLQKDSLEEEKSTEVQSPKSKLSKKLEQ